MSSSCNGCKPGERHCPACPCPPCIGIEIKTASIDGKQIAYTQFTRFYVQVGRGPKGKYKTKYYIQGNLGQAILWYRGINIAYGYKKRLYCPEMNNPVLAKATS